MTSPLTDALRIRRAKGEASLHLPLARLNLRLTAEGETRLLGFVHYYLASWASRTDEGQVPAPKGPLGFSYEYLPDAHLTVPAVGAEAPAVAATILGILGPFAALEHHSAGKSLVKPLGP